MLIEVFTNGKVMIDGRETDKSYKAEEVLYDYLVNPGGFRPQKGHRNKKKRA